VYDGNLDIPSRDLDSSRQPHGQSSTTFYPIRQPCYRAQAYRAPHRSTSKQQAWERHRMAFLARFRSHLPEPPLSDRADPHYSHYCVLLPLFICAIFLLTPHTHPALSQQSTAITPVQAVPRSTCTKKQALAGLVFTSCLIRPRQWSRYRLPSTAYNDCLLGRHGLCNQTWMLDTSVLVYGCDTVHARAYVATWWCGIKTYWVLAEEEHRLP
jgi:hypothetical protein